MTFRVQLMQPTNVVLTARLSQIKKMGIVDGRLKPIEGLYFHRHCFDNRKNFTYEYAR